MEDGMTSTKMSGQRSRTSRTTGMLCRFPYWTQANPSSMVGQQQKISSDLNGRRDDVHENVRPKVPDIKNDWNVMPLPILDAGESEFDGRPAAKDQLRWLLPLRFTFELPPQLTVINQTGKTHVPFVRSSLQ